MELLQLKYFCSAAETENFSATAKKFFVPPSGISQTIKRLEKELDTVLFIREANRITLSEHGKVFYSEVKAALQLIDGAKERLQDESGEVKGDIKLLVLSNRKIITGAIERFKNIYPKTNFHINHSPSEDISEYDVIIADEDTMPGNLEKIPLLSENIKLAVDETNPLFAQDTIELPQLRNQRFVTMQKGNSLFYITNKICGTAGFAPEIAIQGDDPFYIRKYVELGLGIAFAPEISWHGLFSEKITLKNIGNFKRNTAAFYHKNKYQTKAIKEFLALLQKTFFEIDITK